MSANDSSQLSSPRMLRTRALDGPLRNQAREKPSQAAARDADTLKTRIHSRVVRELQIEAKQGSHGARRRSDVAALIERLIDVEGLLLGATERRALVQDLLDEILGLGPLEKLFRDPSLTDILVNGPDQVYVERKGVLEEASVRFRDSDHLLQIIQRIAARVGRAVNESSPIVDARLQDGSRVNAIIPPLSLRGPTLSIRRFGNRPFACNDLINLHAITPEIALLMEAAVKARLNIVISGGTGSGKTTLLNVLSSFIPETERIVTIEDAAELQLQQRHLVQLETRPANIEGNGEVTIRDLVKNALRMRPNRIIVGECRGPEAVDMLQAMNTGHDGSLTTLHANGPRDALTRMEMMFLMAGLDIPLRAIREHVASAIDLVIQVGRLVGGVRRVTSVTEILTAAEEREHGTPDPPANREYVPTRELFRFVQTGVDSQGRALGDFEATGLTPYFLSKLAAAGVHLPPDLFNARVLASV